MSDPKNDAAGTNNIPPGGQGAGDGSAGAGGQSGAGGGQGDVDILGAGGSQDGGAGAGGGAGGGDGGGQGGGQGEPNDDGQGDQGGGAPEAYEFSVPEGMELDAPLIEAVSPVFKSANLSQEQAQGIVDAYNKIVQQRNTEAVQQQEEAVKAWAKEIRDDKEFGGDNYDATINQARLAIRELGGEDAAKLQEFFRRTGLGGHPLLVKVFARAGRLFREDGMSGAGDGAGGSGEEGRAARMFPSSQK